ncbi:MAG: hypothetical protein ACRDHO_02490 [Actinomycetota bacterium]
MVGAEEEDSTEGSTVAHVKERVPRDRPLGVIHSGSRYLYGFGPDSYAVWDAANEGKPVEEFPATREGRMAGWRRYVEMEPAAQQIPPEQAPVREDVEEVEAPSRRGALLVGGGITLALIIGLVAFLLTRPDEGGPGDGGGAVVGPTTTHVDITGAVTLSEDLKQTKFQPPIQGFSNRHMVASWEGAQTQIAFDFDDPTPGDYTTGQLPRLRKLEFFFTPPAATEEIHVRSVQGECNVKIEHAATNGLTGTFECTGVALPGSETEETIDLKGTFSARAS